MALTWNNQTGQLSDSTGDIMTAPSGGVLIFNITAHNTGASANIVNLFVYDNSAAAARKIIQTELAANATLNIESKYVLLSGDKLQGDAATAAEVDYIVSYYVES